MCCGSGSGIISYYVNLLSMRPFDKDTGLQHRNNLPNQKCCGVTFLPIIKDGQLQKEFALHTLRTLLLLT